MFQSKLFNQSVFYLITLLVVITNKANGHDVEDLYPNSKNIEPTKRYWFSGGQNYHHYNNRRPSQNKNLRFDNEEDFKPIISMMEDLREKIIVNYPRGTASNILDCIRSIVSGVLQLDPVQLGPIIQQCKKILGLRKHGQNWSHNKKSSKKHKMDYLLSERERSLMDKY